MTDSSPNPPDRTSELTANETCSKYVELWRQTVEVQQHFNDLEWRIRGLALTAATFALGASAVAAKDGTEFYGISLGSGILLAGVVLWIGFFFVDRYWYHPLLIGSVKHGEKLEVELQSYLPAAGLTKAITESSHIRPPKGLGWLAQKNEDGTLRSDEKLRIFYWIGGATLIIAALLLQLAACSSSNKTTPQEPERVIEVIKPSESTFAPPTTTPGSTTSVAPAPPTTVTITETIATTNESSDAAEPPTTSQP